MSPMTFQHSRVSLWSRETEFVSLSISPVLWWEDEHHSYKYFSVIDNIAFFTYDAEQTRVTYRIDTAFSELRKYVWGELPVSLFLILFDSTKCSQSNKLYWNWPGLLFSRFFLPPAFLPSSLSSFTHFYIQDMPEMMQALAQKEFTSMWSAYSSPSTRHPSSFVYNLLLISFCFSALTLLVSCVLFWL